MAIAAQRFDFNSIEPNTATIDFKSITDASIYTNPDYLKETLTAQLKALLKGFIDKIKNKLDELKNKIKEFLARFGLDALLALFDLLGITNDLLDSFFDALKDFLEEGFWDLLMKWLLGVDRDTKLSLIIDGLRLNWNDIDKINFNTKDICSINQNDNYNKAVVAATGLLNQGLNGRCKDNLAYFNKNVKDVQFKTTVYKSVFVGKIYEGNLNNVIELGKQPELNNWGITETTLLPMIIDRTTHVDINIDNSYNICTGYLDMLNNLNTDWVKQDNNGYTFPGDDSYPGGVGGTGGGGTGTGGNGGGDDNGYVIVTGYHQKNPVICTLLQENVNVTPIVIHPTTVEPLPLTTLSGYGTLIKPLSSDIGSILVNNLRNKLC